MRKTCMIIASGLVQSLTQKQKVILQKNIFKTISLKKTRKKKRKENTHTIFWMHSETRRKLVSQTRRSGIMVHSVQIFIQLPRTVPSFQL